MGYIRGLVHGTVVGTVIGVAIAPQEGRRTRDQMRRYAATAREGIETAQATARRMAPTAQTAMRSVGEVVGTVRGRMRSAEEEELISVNGATSGDYQP